MNTLEFIGGDFYANGKNVSQSGIESGGDATVGYWTKFPDGTAIAHGTHTPGTSISGTKVTTLPFSFIGEASMTAGVSGSGSSAVDRLFASWGWVVNSNEVYIKTMVSKNGVVSILATSTSWQCIGRWK